MNASVSQIQHATRDLLQRCRNSLQRILGIEGAAWWLGLATCLAAASYLVDRTLHLSIPLRLWIGLSGGALLLWFGWRWIVRPIWRLGLSEMDTAGLLDRVDPGFAEHAANILELPEHQQPMENASRTLVELAVQRSYSQLQRFDRRRAIDFRRAKSSLVITAILILCVTAACFRHPVSTQLWWHRWALLSQLNWPQRCYLGVPGLRHGTLYVPRMETSLLTVTSDPVVDEVRPGIWRVQGRPADLLIRSQQKPISRQPDRVHVHYRSPIGGLLHAPLKTARPGQFTYRLPPLQEPLAVHFYAADDLLDVTIEPVERPQLTEVWGQITLPGNDSSETMHAEPADPISAWNVPAGTRIKIGFTTNQPCSTAHIRVTGLQTELAPRGSDRFEHVLTVAQTTKATISCVSRATGLASLPLDLQINVRQNQAPKITLRSLDIGPQITPQARLPLEIFARDDSRVRDLSLSIQRVAKPDSGQDGELPSLTLPIPLDDAADTGVITRRTIVEAEHVTAVPGDTLRITAYAGDDGRPEPQQSESASIEFEIVDPAKFMEQVRSAQRRHRVQLEGSSRLWKQTFANLGPMLDPNSDTSETIEQVVALVSRRIWKAAAGLGETHRTMDLNQLGSESERRTLQNSIVIPLEALHEEALAELRTALTWHANVPSDERSPEQITQLSQDVTNQLDAILVNMHAWEAFSDVIRQLESVMEWQERNLQRTRRMARQRLEDLFDE